MRRSRRTDLGLTFAEQRGEASEIRVEEMLRQLAADDKIDHFIRLEAGEQLDRMGMDFLVFPEQRQNWNIPLQVKSSYAGQREHIEHSPRNYPCIVVRDEHSDEYLKELILEALGLSTNSLLNNISNNREDAGSASDHA